MIRSQSQVRLRGESNKWRTKDMVEMIRRKPILLIFTILLLFGIAVYCKLWFIDYSLSTDETALLRSQFDLAHREAVDESAEWRLRFDEERDRANKCMEELVELKASLGEQAKDTPALRKSLEVLKKENKDLLERLELLEQELRSEKLKCKSQ